jgi:hypothetical protein
MGQMAGLRVGDELAVGDGLGHPLAGVERYQPVVLTL